MSAKIAVIYYSATGNVHKLAMEVVAGAEEHGAEVRLRRAPETAPREAIESRDEWREHVDTVASEIEEATNDDLDWADGLALGSPTRYGSVTSQLQSFIDQTGPLWQEGKLADKAATAFTSSQTAHGGLETTIVSVHNTFTHWGSIIVPPGYTDPVMFESGTPYGAAFASGSGGPSDAVRKAARHQGARLARFAALLAA
ncbi:MAG: NAD(P)H:quinone oxidoreductase [Solirubrobacterales bacterium]